MGNSTATTFDLDLRIAALSQEGYSIRDISEMTGVSRRTISRRRIEYGVRGGTTWSPTLCLPTDPGGLGYIAGIIDGEGSIYRRGQDGHWYIKVGMTDENIIAWLGAFGGKVNFRHRGENRKDVWTWHVSRRADVICILKTLLPYLKVKRHLAVEALRQYGEEVS